MNCSASLRAFRNYLLCRSAIDALTESGYLRNPCPRHTRHFSRAFAVCSFSSSRLFALAACKRVAEKPKPGFDALVLDYQTPTDPALQSQLEAIDAALRERHGMTTEQTAVGVLDLQTLARWR